MELNLKRKPGRRPSDTKNFILTVVKYVLQHDISYAEAARHFKVSNRTQVNRWVKKYHSEIAGLNDIGQMPTLSPSEQRDDNCASQTKALQKALEDSALKISVLETMIDLAETTYKISIRKNFGTKQHE